MTPLHCKSLCHTNLLTSSIICTIQRTHTQTRHFHASAPLSRKKSRTIRPYAPTHPTRESMSEAIYDVRKISSQHNVYHPDEIDFRGFIKSLPIPNYQNDLAQYLDKIELLELIPKMEDMGGSGDSAVATKRKRRTVKRKKSTKMQSSGLLEEDDDAQEHDGSIAASSEASQSSTQPATISQLYKSQYAQRLIAWIEKNQIPYNDINIIFRTFIHPNWLVHCFPEDINIRNLINRISNQKLSQKGSDILNFVLESYLTSHTEHNSSFLQHYEENRTKMTLLMYNDPMRFQDYMNRDLKETHKRLMSNEALAYAAKKLDLKSLLLSHFDIVEDHEVSEDDLLPRTDPEYMVFPASKRAVVQNHDSILNANLLEALVGAIHLDSGMEAATRFIVDHVRPLLYEYVQVCDQMDYPRELARLLKQFRSQVEYRALKDPVNRGEVKVGVFIGTRHIDAAFGETFAIAKYRAAQKVYLDLRHNPVKIKQLEDSLVNQGYVQSMHFLKLQRIRDCMEFVPGAYQKPDKKHYKVNKGDINFYIQNKPIPSTSSG